MTTSTGRYGSGAARGGALSKRAVLSEKPVPKQKTNNYGQISAIRVGLRLIYVSSKPD
jgi:hypothetical protein